MSYPDKFIRGIPNESLMENGYPKSDLFKNFDANSERSDQFKELSINWHDDAGALQKILEQKKANSEEYQFKVGGAFIQTDELKKLCKKPQISNFLAYERNPLNDNGYHGNLLLKDGTSKGIRDMIATALALYAVEIERRII